MNTITLHRYVVLAALLLGCFFSEAVTTSEQALQKGFVYLDTVDGSIKASLRYATDENFIGKPIVGYKVLRVIMTRQAAEALKKVQEDVKKDGYCLVIYDAYRPQRAVNNFMRWSKDVNDQKMKEVYYPRIDKARVFELGYVAERSGHSRGSTVDCTLIKVGQGLHAMTQEKRTLLDGFTFTYLNDGTVDMGSHFDLFDVASHYSNNVIDDAFKKMRTYLKNVMEKHGFKGYSEEWWHFTLADEPYKSDNSESYFDFIVT